MNVSANTIQVQNANIGQKYDLCSFQNIKANLCVVGNMVKVLRGHQNWVYCCAFSPDSSILCSVGAGKAVSIQVSFDFFFLFCFILFLWRVTRSFLQLFATMKLNQPSNCKSVHLSCPPIFTQKPTAQCPDLSACSCLALFAVNNTWAMFWSVRAHQWVKITKCWSGRD